MQIIWVEKQTAEIELGNSDYCMNIVENNEVITMCLCVPGTALDYAYFSSIIINSSSFLS